MLEDERRENGLEGDSDLNSNDFHKKDIDLDQDDIFAEDDVVIPDNMMGQDSDSENVNFTGNVQGSEEQCSCAQQDSVYRKAKSEIPYSRLEDTGKQTQSQSQQYSYIPNDQDNKSGRYDSNVTRKERKQRKHMNNYAKAIVCAVLCGVIVGGCILGSFAIGKNVVQPVTPDVATNQEKLAESETVEVTPDVQNTERNQYTVSQIAKQCGTSVVAITNRGVSEVQTMFGTFQQESQGSGSGVIVSKTDTELLVVSNYHVVEGAKELTVCFNDSADAVYNAQIKGTDASNDLAVVALNLSDISEDVLNSISIATMGDSDSMEVGDGVVAIGNALGLGRSVTYGVISALNREVTIDENTSTLIQTDAAINPGNSGGALFNMQGELIGINSAKFASEQVEGMGFAIPMSTARPIMENLMTKETRTKLTENYGCLNIKGGDVSADEAKRYGVPRGVYVSSVFENCAAANAGMQEGDIITSIGGYEVTGINELKNELQYFAAGETVTVVIQRNEGKGYVEKELSVTLDNASEQNTSTGQSIQNNQGSDPFGGSSGNGFNFW